MKYIRTKLGIYEVVYHTHNGFEEVYTCHRGIIKEHEIIRRADTIEALCDEFVVENDYDFGIYHTLKQARQIKGKRYGAIWTDNGLIYVAKLNEKGELELL